MKLALVSGGSRGLGEALCMEYRSRGFHVIEYSRSAPHPWSVACDFARPVEVEDILRRSFAPYREAALDELVVISNAATLSPMGRAGSCPAGQVATNLSVNFTAAVVFMNTALQFFASHPCRKIVASISSGAALKPYAGWSLYCAAKAGLEHFVRAVAAEQENAAHPFRLLNVDPGVMDTGMQAAIRAATPDEFPSVARFVERHRQGALQPPARIASTIAALIASEAESGVRRSAFPI